MIISEMLPWLDRYPLHRKALILRDDLDHGLCNRQVVFWSGNMSVVQVVNQQSARSPPVISLLRFFVPKCLQFSVCFRARHVPGTANDIADALSRLQLDHFRALAPLASLEGLRCLAYFWNLISDVC